MSHHQQPSPGPSADCLVSGSSANADAFARRLRSVAYDARAALPSLLDGLTELRRQFDNAPAVGALFVRVSYPSRAIRYFSWEQIVGIYDALALTARGLVGVTLRNVDLPADLGLAQEGFAVLLSRPRERGVLHRADVQRVAERYGTAIRHALQEAFAPGLTRRISVEVGSGLMERPQEGQTLEDVLVAGLTEAYEGALRLQEQHLCEVARSIEETLGSGGVAVSYQAIVAATSGLPAGFSALLASSGEAPLSGEEMLIDAARSSGAVSAVYRAFHARAIEGAKAELREDEWLLLPVGMSELIDCAVLDMAALFDEGQVRGIGPSNLVFMVDSLELFAGFPASPAAFKAAAEIGFGLGVDIMLDSLPPLDHLRALSPDFVRLGGRLVEALPSDPDAFELAALLARFCRRHGMRLLGAGCRSAVEYDALRRVGVDLVQGPYVAPCTEVPSRRSFNLG